MRVAVHVVQSVLGAAWKAYWKLSMIPMLLVTAIIGVAVIELVPHLPMAASARASIQGTAGSLVVRTSFVVLHIVGIVRIVGDAE